MAFLLSVLYLVTSYLTPATLFGPLAALHVELLIAILILCLSIPAFVRSFTFKTPQSLALIGLAFAVLFSIAFGSHWVGGGIRAFLAFTPNALAYFLVCLHCNSKKKLQVLVAMLLFVCVFVIAKGGLDLLHGIPDTGPPLVQDSLDVNNFEWDDAHPYVFVMRDDSGEFLYRLRGLGIINDPNDFAQLAVSVIPLAFIFWRKRKPVPNIFFVLLPVAVLLLGIVLTHSRGSLLALVAIAVIAARRRIGTIPALVIAGGIFASAMALNFTGGRNISVTAGEDRTALWGQSLELLKTHPLFGVGFGNLPDYLGHTAHNTVAVCAAELGLFGLFFWSLFLFPTVRDTLVVASLAKVGDPQPLPEPETTPGPMPERKIEILDKATINHLGRLMLLSLVGYMVAGWFLSRAFVLTLFLFAGMAEVVYQMALQREMISPRWPLERVLRYSAGMAAGLVLLLYMMLRTIHFVS